MPVAGLCEFYFNSCQLLQENTILVLVLGLGRIFDVPSSGQSASSTPPAQDFILEESPPSLGISAKAWPPISCRQNAVRAGTIPDHIILLSPDLNETGIAKEINKWEADRNACRWLVYMPSAAAAVIFFPRGSSPGSKSFSKSGLISCMEWLESIKVSQIFVAINKEAVGRSPLRSQLVKNLLFLGFSFLHTSVIYGQLSCLSAAYYLLATGLSDY
ncbi:unnamed protein product [Schistocephalus solidus]|uniref:Uncharacterized protein n=1 Tax=Schistocephalus solidus TaxID=70667 RepID=A0A183SJ67_SCHSO|nr:unnamed protein product [Schistocephalus solidus]